MSKVKDQIKEIANKTKVKVYKPQDNQDDRVSLCGCPVQTDDEGRQYFEIPAHQVEYQEQLHPHYIFGDAFVEDDVPRKRKVE